MNDDIEQELEDDLEEGQVEEEQAEEEGEPVVQVDPAAEEEARKYGWRPLSEFRGNKDGWVDAARFLELPSTQNKQLRDELKSTRETFAERLDRLDNANKAAMRRAMENQKAEYEREMEALRTRQREAVESGDVETWDRLEQQRNRMQPPTQQPDGPPPEVEQYAQSEAGKWVNDPVLKRIGAEAIQSGGMVGRPVSEQLAYAEKHVRQYFPHMFQQQAEQPKQPRNRVDGGGLGGAQRGKGVNSLPAEARAAGKEFVEAGIYKSLDDYAKDYWSQEAAE